MCCMGSCSQGGVCLPESKTERERQKDGKQNPDNQSVCERTSESLLM